MKKTKILIVCIISMMILNASLIPLPAGNVIWTDKNSYCVGEIVTISWEIEAFPFCCGFSCTCTVDIILYKPNGESMYLVRDGPLGGTVRGTAGNPLGVREIVLRLKVGDNENIYNTRFEVKDCDEDCDNGRDDDGDGRVDCNDSDCKNDPDCDPCRDVHCENRCFGCDYWAMECDNGDCVKDYIIERDSCKCGSRCCDPCRDVHCENRCFGCDYWAMECDNGECVKDYIIEEDSTNCGSNCGQEEEITFTYGHYFVICPKDYEQKARKWVKDVDDNIFPIMVNVLGYHPTVDSYVVEFKEWQFAGEYLGFEVVRGIAGGHIVIDLGLLDTLESYPENVPGGLVYETIHGFLDPHKSRHGVIKRSEDFDIIFEIEVLDTLRLESHINQLYNRWYPENRDFSICWDIREQCGWSVFQKFFSYLEDSGHPDIDNDNDWCYYMSIIAQEDLTDIFEGHGRSISSYTQEKIKQDLLSETLPPKSNKDEPGNCLGTIFISLVVFLGLISNQIRTQ